MSDFSPETRNASWWSGDSRRAVSGKAGEVVLQKLGQMPIPDLSGIEAVQMGHVMEPVIGQLAQERLGVDLRKFSDSLTHPKHDWFRSHFDFVGQQNGTNILVECKNYGMHQRNKFDPDAGIIPAADKAQLVHEAAVFGVERIYLAVLFGGAEFHLMPFDVADAQKDELIQQMAAIWSHVKTGKPLPPETAEQASQLYPVSVEGTVTATLALEMAANKLVKIREARKELEQAEDELEALLKGALGERDTLLSLEGKVLATWRSAKSSKRFSATALQSAMPSVYEQFCVEQPGSRRFLIKG